MAAVRKGGVSRLTVVRMDAQRPAFAARSFDVVTMLKVLQHLKNPQSASCGAVAVVRRFVSISVRSVPDENPEHLHLFTADQLRDMAAVAE